MSERHPWLPDVLAGLLVLVLGALEVVGTRHDGSAGDARSASFIVLGIATAVALSRRAPAVALAVVWAVCSWQVASSTPLLVIELAIAAVAFGTARWGSAATVWMSAVSIPAAAFITVYWIDSSVFYAALDTAGFRTIASGGTALLGQRWQLAAMLLGTAVLGVPWLVGLALRFSARARRSQQSQVVAEAARDQAEEIARLREEQAQLARDVHDVVGHSLAVILAQAESAQYLPDVDTQALKQTMSNVANTARASLADVRDVLAATSGASAPRARLADLDSLVEGVRASGHEVVTTEVGVPQPLPPELEVVAFRVLQEMLTNAIRHGRRDRPVLVERHWEGDLRLEVQNPIDGASGGDPDETQPVALAAATRSSGRGIDGMRRRLEAVGGRLDVRRRAEPPTFTATAWVPVRPR